MIRAHWCTETIVWKSWSLPWCWWFLLKFIDLIIIFVWSKPTLKSRTSSYFHFVSSLFFVGSRIFSGILSSFWFCSFILCYPQSYKKPQNILGKGWLLHTAWFIQLKAGKREKISMCQFLQIQLVSVSTNSAVFTKYKPNFITLGTYPL